MDIDIDVNNNNNNNTVGATQLVRFIRAFERRGQQTKLKNTKSKASGEVNGSRAVIIRFNATVGFGRFRFCASLLYST